MKKILALGLLTVTTTFAQDNWPQFRGVNATGLSSDINLPVEFSPTKNVVWKTPVPRGHSSAVFAGNRIYMTAEQGEKIILLATGFFHSFLISISHYTLTVLVSPIFLQAN